jgi:phosphoribosylformylglycinamidine cyclo-ligase
MERTFNMGVGMVAIVGAQDTDRALDLLAERGLPSWVVGQITAGSGTVHLTGQHSA